MVKPAVRFCLSVAIAVLVPGHVDTAPQAQPAARGRLSLRIQLPERNSRGGDNIRLAAFSPDGRHALNLGAAPGIVETGSGRQLRALPIAPNTEAVAFSSDGRMVAADSGTGSVQIWDVQTGREMQAMAGRPGQRLNAIAFSPDGRQLIGGLDGVAIWDVSSGALVRRVTLANTPPREFEVAQMIRQFKETREAAMKLLAARVVFVNALRVTADGRRAFLSANGAVRVLDLATGREGAIFGLPDVGLRLVSVSPDGRWLVTESTQLQVWDTTTSQVVREFRRPTGVLIGFATDGRHIEEVTTSGRRLIDVETGAVAPSAITPGWYESASGVERNQATADGKRRLRDITGAPNPRATGLAPMTAPIGPVMLSADGRWMLTGGINASPGRLWDANTGQPFANLPQSIRGPLKSIEGGKVVGDSPTGLSVWDALLNQVTPLLPFGTLPGQVSANRRWMVSRVTGTNETIRITDLQAATPVVRTIELNEPASVLLAGNGSILLTYGVSGLRTWNTATGQLERVLALAGSRVDALAVSDDGRLAAASGIEPGAVVTWDTTTGRRGASLILMEAADARTAATVDSRLETVQFSPNGRALLTIQGGVVVIFDVATGRRAVRTLSSGKQGSAAFSANSRLVVVAMPDGSARLFDLVTGAEVATILQTSDDRWAVVAADGRFDTNALGREVPMYWIDEAEPDRPMPIELFMNQFYMPQLLGKLLAGEPLPPVPDISSLNRAQPAVKITSVETRPLDPSRVDVTVEVTETVLRGRKSGVRDLRLFRAGQLVASRSGAVALDAKGHAVVRFEGVQLREDQLRGEVTFSAYAFNVDRVKSATVESPFKPWSILEHMQAGAPIGPKPGDEFLAQPPLDMRRFRRAFVVAIGVNDTPRAPELRLRFAVNDAKKMAEVLAGPLKRTFAEVNVSVLTSEAEQPSTATRALIRAEFDRLAKVVRPQDLVFISFSGHGFADKAGTFSIYPSDVVARAVGMPAGAIAAADLADWLRPIDAVDLVLILDTCHSAASVEAGGFRPGPMGDAGLGQLAYDKGMRILAASQAADVAMETDRLQKGLLSYALIDEGLTANQADWSPRDGSIGLGEWLAYGVQRVPTLLADVKAGRLRAAIPVKGVPAGQRPALFDFKGAHAPEVVLVRR